MSSDVRTQTKKQRRAETRALKTRRLQAMFDDNTVMFNRMKDQEKQLKESSVAYMELSKEKRTADIHVSTLSLQVKTRDATMEKLEKDLMTWGGVLRIAWRKLRGQRSWR